MLRYNVVVLYTIVLATTTLLLADPILAFSPCRQILQRSAVSTRLRAIDPSALQDLLLHHHPYTASPQHVADLANGQTLEGWETLLSTMYTSAAKAPLHSNGWFSAPDPYLQKMQSIPPLEGVTTGAPALPQENGLTSVPDGSFRVESTIPDLFKTDPPTKDMDTYKRQLGYSAITMFRINNLPRGIVFATAIDFFIVSAGLDLYKEEITDDPDQANAIFVADWMIRLTSMAIVTALTMLVYN